MPHITVLAVSVPLLSRCKPLSQCDAVYLLLLCVRQYVVVVTAVMIVTVPYCRVLPHGCNDDVVLAFLLLGGRLELDDLVVMRIVISCVSR